MPCIRGDGGDGKSSAGGCGGGSVLMEICVVVAKMIELVEWWVT